MKPRFYVAVNRDNCVTFVAPPTIAACVLQILNHEVAVEEAGEVLERHPGCIFVLVARDSTLEFLHADRFLDGVASGDISEETSQQAFPL